MDLNMSIAWRCTVIAMEQQRIAPVGQALNQRVIGDSIQGRLMKNQVMRMFDAGQSDAGSGYHWQEAGDRAELAPPGYALRVRGRSRADSAVRGPT